MMDPQMPDTINKKHSKDLLRIISMVLICLEIFFFTFEEGLDLAFSYGFSYNSKLPITLVLILLNCAAGIALMYFVYMRLILPMLFGAIVYLILGLSVLIYILIERYSGNASEARPMSYYELEIDIYSTILYYSSGALLIAASIIMFVYAKLLQNEAELREKHEELVKDNFVIEEDLRGNEYSSE